LEPWDSLYQFALQYGFLGVFVISAIGASTIVVPIPYTFVIYLLGAFMDPVILTLAGGLGAAIGVLTGYFLGYYGRIILSEEQQRKMNFLVKIFGGNMSVVIFIFAFTPLPDALIFIPLGIARYNLVKVWIPNFLGKLLMSYVLATAGRLSIGFIRDLFGESGWIGIVLSTVFLIIILVVMFKLDWEKIFEKYFMRGSKQSESDS
jgi:membrane protein YqaA with SNARE-associated domain